MPNTNATGYEPGNILIQGFNIHHGSCSIFIQNGINVLTLRDMDLTPNFGAGVYMRGFVSGLFFRDVLIPSGSYGLYYSSTGLKSNGVTTGTGELFDKNNFYSMVINGQTENGIYIVNENGAFDNNTFTDLQIVSVSKSGVYIGGGARAMTFLNLNTEENGGNTLILTSTATTTSGSATVTVGTNTFVNGSTLTISGADSNGADWYPVIASGGGTKTLVMLSSASTSVTSADTVNNIYSDVELKGAGGSGPAGVTFVNANIGAITDNGLRYSIDASGANNVSCINCLIGRPIYDPNVTVSNFSQNISGKGVRRPNNNLVDTYHTSTFGGGSETPRTIVASPPGKDIVLGLADVNGDNTTFGSVEVRKNDGSATRLLKIDSSGNMTTAGTINNLTVNSSSITLQGNTFNGNTNLVQTNASGFIPNLSIVGRTNSTTPATANIGAYVSTETAITNASASGTWINASTLTLTAGDWDITAKCRFLGNSATMTQEESGISTDNTTNSFSDLDASNNAARWGLSVTDHATVDVPNYQQSFNSQTNYITKVRISYSGGTAQWKCTSFARRMS